MALLSLVQEARSVALAWDSPADPSVVRLRVILRHLQRKLQPAHDVGNTTIAAISNLAVGYTYFFAVTAYDAPWSRKPYLKRSVFYTQCESSAPGLEPFQP